MLIEASASYLIAEDFNKLGQMPLEKQITMIRSVADVFNNKQVV